MDTEKEAMFKRIEELRGFRFGLHDFLAEVWPEFLEQMNHYLEFTYLRDKLLDRKTRELCMVAALCATADSEHHTKLHMKAAAAAGVTKEEVLEVIGCIGYWIGAVRQMEAMENWRQVFAPDIPSILQIKSEPRKVE